MLHFVTSYMKQNKSRKQTLESAQYRLEISFNLLHLCPSFLLLGFSLFFWKSRSVINQDQLIIASIVQNCVT